MLPVRLGRGSPALAGHRRWRQVSPSVGPLTPEPEAPSRVTLLPDLAYLSPGPRPLVHALLLALAAFLLASVVVILIRRAVAQVARHLSDTTALDFVSAFAQLLTYLVAFVLYAHLIPELRALGTALLAGVSVVSVVIGIAAQNTLGNIIAGFWLVLTRTIRVGDHIRLNSGVGTISARVRSISLAHTVLTDQDGHEVVVPNNVIVNSIITRTDG